MKNVQQGKNTAILKRNGLTVECFFNENGRLARKVERYDRQFTEYVYQYDAKGHLTRVRRNGMLVESYQYNPSGQRVEHNREYRGFSDSTGGMLLYDDDGRLIRAGDTMFYYDKHGALAERCDCRGITRYTYGKDTMPDAIVLPSGGEIRYEYDAANPISPARRFRNGVLTSKYIWADYLRLAMYKDYDNLLEYSFVYTNAAILDKVRIDILKPEKRKNSGKDSTTDSDWLGRFVTQKRRERMHDFLGKRSLPFELRCGCDQVGTLKILTDKNGRLVKEVVYDSFGVQQSDSFPDLFMPIGFAGGLVDPDTGLVRFGYRDYDPGVGRFTAPDPLGDTGGDHDVYDYCIDDPVTMNDPSGLFPPLILFLGAKVAALGIAAISSLATAAVVDGVKSARDGEISTEALATVFTTLPRLGKASLASAVPGIMATTAPAIAGAVTLAGQRVGAEIASSPYRNGLARAARFAEGYFDPNPPASPTPWGTIGATTAGVKRYMEQK